MAVLHPGSKKSNIDPSVDKFMLETIFNPIGVKLYLHNEEIPVELEEKPNMWGVIDFINTGPISDIQIESSNSKMQEKEIIIDISCFQKMRIALGVGSDRYGLSAITDRCVQELGPLGYIPILDFNDELKPQVSALQITDTPSYRNIDEYEPHGIRMCVVSITLCYSEVVAY